MQAAWHGEVPLINDLNRVFEQGESENIGIIKQEVRQYEKDIKKRGAAIVNQERTKAEKQEQKRSNTPM